jgi:hypothetical protein
MHNCTVIHSELRTTRRGRREHQRLSLCERKRGVTKITKKGVQRWYGHERRKGKRRGKKKGRCVGFSVNCISYLPFIHKVHKPPVKIQTAIDVQTTACSSGPSGGEFIHSVEHLGLAATVRLTCGRVIAVNIIMSCI